MRLRVPLHSAFLAVLVIFAAMPLCATEDLDEGARAYQRGDIRSAQAYLTKALQSDPHSQVARISWARLQLHVGHVSDAAADVASLLAEDKPLSDAHTLYGDVLFRQGAFARAESEYRTALQANAQDALAWFGLGRLATLASLHKRAARYYARAHELAPLDYEIAHRWAMSRSSVTERLAAYQAALAQFRTEGIRTDYAIHAIALLKALNGKQPYQVVSPYQRLELPLVPITENAELLHGWGLRVRINGAKPVLLLLDTAASGIVLSRRASERTNLRRIGEERLTGLGDDGPLHASTAVAERVTIGTLEFANCVVDITDRKRFGSADGLIGLDVFDEFIATLDFPRAKLSLEPHDRMLAGEPHDRERTPRTQDYFSVYRSDNLLLLPVMVNDGGSHYFVFDTGSDVSSISTELGGRVSSLDRSGTVVMTGVSGKVHDVRRAEWISLEFAGMRQSGYDLTSLSMDQISNSAGTEVSGTLGMASLNLLRVSIDYRNGLMKMDRQQ